MSWAKADQREPSDAEMDPTTPPPLSHYMIDGGTFLHDVPEAVPTVWGEDDAVLWAEGESLIIVGGNGVGKTTIASQLVRGRLGLQRTCLGLPITPGGRVLYLAMDRPAQCRRALARLFRSDPREVLEQQLVFWKGPPPMDLAKSPGVLLELCGDAKADTVIVDSLKDAAIGLSEDEVGAGWNRARQGALAAGVQVLELHHLVKRGANGAAPKDIADVYGSAWITGGAGSVVILDGKPGDPIVQMRHLKQPAAEVGPWTLEHDHERGVTYIATSVDLLAMVRNAGLPGLTVGDAAKAMFDTETPSRAESAKATRALEKLRRKGYLVKSDDPPPKPSVYHLAARQEAV